MTLEKEKANPIDASVCLINKAAVLRYYKLHAGDFRRLVKQSLAKQYILDVARHTRYHPFSRVSVDALIEVCAGVRLCLERCATGSSDALVLQKAGQIARWYCHKIVQRNPSIGRTLK